jgi:hypothetical protein
MGKDVGHPLQPLPGGRSSCLEFEDSGYAAHRLPLNTSS